MTKEVLIFIHGGGVDQWMWAQQVQEFSDFECITPTLQGHGIRADDRAFSIRQNAMEIIELIEQQFQGRTIHLIGFSVGAQIAIDILHLQPHLVKTGMINSALVIPQKRLATYSPFIAKWSVPLMRSHLFNLLQAKQLRIPHALLTAYQTTSRTIHKKTLTALLAENLQFSLPPNLQETSTKVLVTVGGKERPMMRQSAQRIASANQNFQLIECAAIGHHFPLSHPQAFNQLIRMWIS